MVEVSLGEKYEYMDNEGNIQPDKLTYLGPDADLADTDGAFVSGTTTGEGGRMGITLLPGQGESGVNSPSQNTIKIIVHKNLSSPARSEIYSHEGMDMR